MIEPTHRTKVQRVAHVWWWALERIADGAIVAKGRCSDEQIAIDAAVEAGHARGLARVDQDHETPTALMR